MIFTLTFNPSLDYVIEVNNLQIGCVNRTQTEELYAGGKGINVSLVLKNLGVESCALGFTAGFVGAEIEKRLAECGCRTSFVRLKEGSSRINVKIKGGSETEINANGPEIPEEALFRLYAQLDGLTDEDVLVIAGSVPRTLPEDIYENICRRLAGRGVRIAVDASGRLLTGVLAFRPFLIKPNRQELEETFGAEIKNIEDVIFYAKKLQSMGARNVLVSMAGDGAVLITENGEALRGVSPRGDVVNSVGAGDSMVAGFLAGWLRHGDYKTALLTGLAAGSACAFSPWLAGGGEIKEMLARAEVKSLL